MPRLRLEKRMLIAAVLPLVLGIAVQSTGTGTCRTADQRACTRVTRLMADDRTGARA